MNKYKAARLYRAIKKPPHPEWFSERWLYNGRGQRFRCELDQPCPWQCLIKVFWDL